MPLDAKFTDLLDTATRVPQWRREGKLYLYEPHGDRVRAAEYMRSMGWGDDADMLTGTGRHANHRRCHAYIRIQCECGDAATVDGDVGIPDVVYLYCGWTMRHPAHGKCPGQWPPP